MFTCRFHNLDLVVIALIGFQEWAVRPCDTGFDFNNKNIFNNKNMSDGQFSTDLKGFFFCICQEITLYDTCSSSYLLLIRYLKDYHTLLCASSFRINTNWVPCKASRNISNFTQMYSVNELKNVIRYSKLLQAYLFKKIRNL